MKSGAFITIETALEQGKDVFAVPGQIYNPLSAGPHRFLQEGAKLTISVNDILEEYQYKPMTLFPELEAHVSEEQNTENEEKQEPVSLVSLNEEESCVLQYITAEPVTIEELAYLCRMPIAQLMPILSMLELYGLVQQMIGRKYIRIG